MSRAGVAIVDVQATDNPNYLFVTVEIAGDAAPGAFDIEFVEAGKVADFVRRMAGKRGGNQSGLIFR